MRRTVAGFLVALVAGGLLLAVEPASGQVEGGGNGVVRGSATTVTVADGEFAGLKINVSQTTGLGNQAVEVTWEGATPTPRTRVLGTDFLQIMQCWGDPNDPADPKGLKFRETCQFGTNQPQPNTGSNGSPASYAAIRQPTATGESSYPARDPDESLPKEAKIVPFRPIGENAGPDGSPAHPFPKIKDPAPPHQEREMTDLEVLSRHFSLVSTNEVAFALSTGAGTGRAVFEVQNAALAPHLGCGARYTDVDGKDHAPPKCSLVIVPRGHRNPYTGAEAVAVPGSPLLPALWKNRIVVPLDFDPVGSLCPLTQAERRTTGTELVAEAFTSWQPALCENNGPVFGYSSVNDFEVGQQVASTSTGAPGLGFSADPVPDPTLLHAPATLSAPVIALNVDANIRDVIEGVIPSDINELRGLALSDVKLTPRLVAKMLTFSYTYDVAGTPAAAMSRNPHSLRFDREFLDLNPTFEYWPARLADTLNGLMVTVGSSVAARDVWLWIAGDAAAKKWLSGTPDENGMVVNPAYKGMSTTLDSYPKLDPNCARGTAPEYDQVLNCTFGYRPYMGSLGEAALQTLRADVKATSNFMDSTSGTFDPTNPKFTAVPRQTPGYRFSMSITDSASAARYGLYAAQLCKASRGSDGKFTATDCRAPTVAGMTAAAAAMTPSQVTGVSTIDPAKAWATAGAYPLTTVSYAVADTSESAEARRDYAKLLRYIAGSGQEMGTADGQLPEGYAPLTAAMREQTMIAADKLQNWVAATTPPSGDDGASPTPTAPASVPASGTGPSPGLSPSTSPPAVAPAAQSTLGSPLGIIRFLLIAALVMGLLGGVAGPIMQRLAVRVGRK